MLLERHPKELLVKLRRSLKIGNPHGNVIQGDGAQARLLRRGLGARDQRGEGSGELAARQAAAFEISDHSFNDELHACLQSEIVLESELNLAHAHLTEPRQHGNLSDRTRGFVRALQSAKNSVHPIVLHGKFNFDGGTELTRKLLDEHPEVTAIFAANDVMAFGVVPAVLGRGLRIPEDLSLIGFDNIEFSAIVHPPLTTIHQPKYEMGSAAVDILLRLARDKGKQIPEHRRLGVELMKRQSCQQPLAVQSHASRK